VTTAALVATALGATLTAAAWLRARRRYVVITVEGHSMLPALPPRARVLVRRGAPAGTGDVVVLARPRRDGLRPGWHWPPPGSPGDAWMIKRVAAVAGEPVPEALRRAAEVDLGSTVPAGHVTILSDNPRGSLDSRHLGHVPSDRVVGTVRRRIEGRGAAPPVRVDSAG
jgi:signal peptidase I